MLTPVSLTALPPLSRLTALTVMMRALRTLSLVLLAGIGLPSWAHPHMWIDAKVELQFDAQGQLVGIGQRWLFDEMFSSYAKQGLPMAENKSPPQAELDQIGKRWMEALADPLSHYFTTITHRGERLAVGDPRAVKVRWDATADRLSLSFDLPLLNAVSPRQGAVVVSVADPTYFVAYSLDAPDAVQAPAAPSACQAVYRPPGPLDSASAQRLAALPSDQGALPPDLAKIAQSLQHRVELTCD